MRNLNQNKLHITSLLNSVVNIDILGLTETHLSDEPADIFKILGYNFLNRNRFTGKCGGVGMYVKNSVSFERREDLENTRLECIWIEVQCKSAKNFLIYCIYRPPYGSRYLPKDFNDLFSEMISLAIEDNKEIIVLGDLNVNYLNKDDNKEFKQLLTLLGFKQVIKSATRVCDTTETLIDIIATNKSENIRSSDIFPTSFSDHDLVGCVRKLNHVKFKPKEIRCRDYSNYNHNTMNAELQNSDWQNVYNSKNVNTAWQYFNQTVSTVFNKHAPFIMKRIKVETCTLANT